MARRVLSFVLVFIFAFNLIFVNAASDQSEVQLFCPNCNAFQLQGIATEHSYCPKCGGLLFAFGGGDGRGSGAGRRPGAASIEVPKQYYTTPSAGSGNSYNGGTTSYYSVMNTQNNTLNFTTYNKTTNNYTQNNYTYNNYTYNNEYNYYTYNIENHNYYVTNNYTYVTVVYPDGTKDENGNDNYESVDIYYKLPDGRNSYDLKADEIYGTYLTYNVTGAQKVLEDDGVTLGLWHLDGTLQDSSANVGKYIFYSGSTTFVDVELDDWGKAVSASTPYDFGVSGFSGGSPHSVEFRCYVASSSQKAKVYLPYTFTRNYTLVRSNFWFDEGRTQKTIALTDRYYIEVPANQWNSVYLYSSGSDLSVYVNGSPASHYYYSNTGKPSVIYQNAGFPNITNNIKSYNDTSWYTVSDVISSNYSTFGDFTFSDGTKFTLDEFRLSNSQLYDGTYLPSSQPFDTNSVLIRPENPAENDIVVMSNIPVADYRIGGVRPTYPVTGSTFIYLENDVVQSIQQYQGDGWVSVDAFIWQDGEWKNLLKYNFADLKFEEPDDPDPSPSPSPGPGECKHEYVVDSEKAPTCTVKGTTTYKCKLCGDTYSEDIPALGHDWHVVGTGGGSVSSVSSSTSGSSSVPASSAPPEPTATPVAEPEYTLYRCSRCGMEYKDYDGGGPPDDDPDDGGSIWDKVAEGIADFLGVIGDIIGGLLSGILNLLTSVLSSVSQALPLVTEFSGVIVQFYSFLPGEWQVLLTAAFSIFLILGVVRLFYKG